MPTGAAGLLLAAGAGTRYGRAKATVRDPDGTSWLARSVGVLLEGGCDNVTVVLGAEAEAARTHLDDVAASVVIAPDWETGISASLRHGLAALADDPDGVERAVLSLVDLPDVGAAVVARLLGPGGGVEALLRATYDGRPGHPVVLGRAHWTDVLASVSGDRGAGPYLGAHGALEVECGDLATGVDQDEPVRS